MKCVFDLPELRVLRRWQGAICIVLVVVDDLFTHLMVCFFCNRYILFSA